MLETNRNKLLEHPLFEILVQLKWLHFWRIYTATFFFLLLHLTLLAAFAIVHFGNILSDNQALVGNQISFYLLLATNCFLSVLQLAKLHSVHRSNKKKTMSKLSRFAQRRDHVYPILDLVTPCLAFLVLFLENRELTGILILYESWQFMNYLTVFPRVGKNIFITSQVRIFFYRTCKTDNHYLMLLNNQEKIYNIVETTLSNAGYQDNP